MVALCKEKKDYPGMFSESDVWAFCDRFDYLESKCDGTNAYRETLGVE